MGASADGLRQRRRSQRVARLDRFKDAQADPGAGFESAVAELRAGRKQGHWIWYIFPQLSGLGISSFSQLYGIDGRAEATEYLQDQLLRSRLLTVTETVAERLREGVPLRTLMGSSIDVQKLVSSLTLFGEVATELSASESSTDYESLSHLAAEVLAAAAREGVPHCRFTLAALVEP
jgi:uncharacterized protein (DUF1810 family)